MIRDTIPEPPAGAGTALMPIFVRCERCRTEYKFEVKASDLVQYKKGANPQAAFPYLKPEQQLLLADGLCQGCWDVNEGAEDDEEYDR